jgi:hypothetical protein
MFYYKPWLNPMDLQRPTNAREEILMGDVQYFGFSGSNDLNDFIGKMTELLPNPGDHRPVALFFGRPKCPVMKDVILPDIEYYHFRSHK